MFRRCTKHGRILVMDGQCSTCRKEKHMAGKIVFDVTMPVTYVRDGEEKTNFRPVGVAFKTNKGGYSVLVDMPWGQMKLVLFPHDENRKNRGQQQQGEAAQEEFPPSEEAPFEQDPDLQDPTP